MRLKKLKICFCTSDYEINANYSKYWYLILDKERSYYGIKFAIDSNKIYYGNLICENTGIEYESHYKIRKFYDVRFYHYCKFWKEKGWKPKWLGLSVHEAKKKV